ncbi:hypothetical protein M422DRAFT_55402 [Sphaerobolus stellatus SS14]|uniref:RecF/RecN/SMC N-terminal domain-containing protein n=1 Tax=Sphaerobolus stellatus (strain SS14) TaxID=990650 RepID=A0A0C9UC12_SPHS4|nr:hypothetical protein M422DRAFT_55402 [Sphaerobolus stellatus SS14]
MVSKRRLEDDDAAASGTEPRKRPRVGNTSQPDHNIGHVFAEDIGFEQNRQPWDTEEEDEADLDAPINPANWSQAPLPDEDESSSDPEETNREPKKRSDVLEIGVLESVELHNFMCHKNFTFKLGPRMNIITGSEPLLSARREKRHSLSIDSRSWRKSKLDWTRKRLEISYLRWEMNQGEEAYKHELYGDRIIITRRFTVDGASSYKIKTSDLRVVSTRRDELTAICDSMSIQIDNPLTILNQDSSRQLLVKATPNDHYEFFMKATLLDRLQEDYETCWENIKKTAGTLKRKKEELYDLETTLNAVETRNQAATRARELDGELVQCRRELAWAYVRVKEEKLRESLEKVEAAKITIQRIEDRKIPKADRDVASAEAKVEEITSRKDAISTIQSIYDELEEIRSKIKRVSGDIRECKMNENEINVQVTSFNDQLSAAEADIERRGNDTSIPHSEREALQEELETVKAELEGAREELQEAQAEPAPLKTLTDKGEEDLKALEERVRRKQEEINAATANIEDSRNTHGDRLRGYGNNLDKVLEHVQNERWMGETPIGPFGLYVNVKDRKWVPLLRGRLGNAMTNWVITSSRDRTKLRKILDDNGNRDSQIIISEIDLFDYSRGEPPDQILTVLRVLDCFGLIGTLQITNEFVKRLLINTINIERIVLADTRDDADKILLQLRKVLRYADGGGMSDYRSVKIGFRDPKQHMFSGSDKIAEIRRWEDAKKLAEAQSIRRVSDVRGRLLRLERRSVELEQVLQEEAPIEIDMLEEKRQTLLQEKKHYADQFRAVIENRNELEKKQKLFAHQKDKLNAEVLDYEDKMHHIESEYEDAFNERLLAQKGKTHWEKLEHERTILRQLKSDADMSEADFEDGYLKAEEIGERIENPRKPEDIKAQMDSLKAVLAECRREQGGSPDEIAVEHYKARVAFESHKARLDDLTNLIKVLKESLGIRVERWLVFKSHMSRRCKDNFQYCVYTRGYYGKLLFNHEKRTMNLRVLTEDQALKGTASKDPKALSGGERSYSTICFLLGMWKSSHSAIRCLDEFDVFMDSANSRISMKMLLDHASETTSQFILITPQKLSQFTLNPDIVSVVEMKKPERNQGTLHFGR